MNLQDKNAVVTGVSRGIGLHLCRQLLAKGATVAGWGRSKPDINHPAFFFHQTDIRKEEEVHRSFEATRTRFGENFDVLINNAGLGYFRLLEDITTSEWKEMFEVNVFGAYCCAKNILPLMKSRGSGHIVNIASVAGLTGIPEATGYCGTKFAIRGISQALSKEAAKFGVKVSCIFPGSVNTDFFRHYPGVTANETMMEPGEVAGQIIHLLETSPNFNPLELEIRPVQVRYQ